MKAVDAAGAVFQVALQAESNAAEGHFLPWNVAGLKESHLLAFLAGKVVWRTQTTPVEEVHLVDMCNADHGERGVDDDFGTSLLKRFP